MNFKDALLINEGIILEATTEIYLNKFNLGNGPISNYLNNIVKIEVKNFNNTLSFPAKLSNGETIDIPVKKDSIELNKFIKDVYNTAINKNTYTDGDLESLKISLNKFKQKVINYK
jgi:hypothetical protein